MRTDEKYLKYKERLKQGVIRKRTPVRAKDEKYYSVEAKEKWEEAVRTGANICFFCGEKIKKYDGWHHLRKREGGKLREWEYIVLCHNECHLDYHFQPINKLAEKDWWEGFMTRLKEKDELTYKKLLNRIEKNRQNEIRIE